MDVGAVTVVLVYNPADLSQRGQVVITAPESANRQDTFP